MVLALEENVNWEQTGIPAPLIELWNLERKNEYDHLTRDFIIEHKMGEIKVKGGKLRLHGLIINVS